MYVGGDLPERLFGRDGRGDVVLAAFREADVVLRSQSLRVTGEESREHQSPRPTSGARLPVRDTSQCGADDWVWSRAAECHEEPREVRDELAVRERTVVPIRVPVRTARRDPSPPLERTRQLALSALERGHHRRPLCPRAVVGVCLHPRAPSKARADGRRERLEMHDSLPDLIVDGAGWAGVCTGALATSRPLRGGPKRRRIVETHASRHATRVRGEAVTRPKLRVEF